MNDLRHYPGRRLPEGYYRQALIKADNRTVTKADLTEVWGDIPNPELQNELEAAIEARGATEKRVSQWEAKLKECNNALTEAEKASIISLEMDLTTVVNARLSITELNRLEGELKHELSQAKIQLDKAAGQVGRVINVVNQIWQQRKPEILIDTATQSGAAIFRKLQSANKEERAALLKVLGA